MATALRTALLSMVLATSPAWATASFANREVGLGVAGFAWVPPAEVRVAWGVPLTLEGGVYLEDHFALYLRIPLMLVKETGGALDFGLGGQFGVRYLFLEETVRPYVMLHLAGLWLFRGAGPNFFAGPGTGLGVDFFVSDSISLGFKGTADLYLTITNNEIRTQFALGGGISATTYF